MIDNEGFKESNSLQSVNKNNTSDNDEDIDETFSLENISKKSNIEELKNGLIKLKRQLEEEKSNSKQAAEYGLSLLDDFKKLQTKNYELEGEIDTLKADLESTNLVSNI
jgi:hypothetical protein